MNHRDLIEALILKSNHRRVCEVEGPIATIAEELATAARSPALAAEEELRGDHADADYFRRLGAAAQARADMLRLADHLDAAIKRHEEADAALARC